MLARILRKVLDASSLISPLGRTHRRIAACKSRKSPSDAQRAASSGNSSASSRNCCFNQPEVSSSDPASRNSAGSSTVPGASSRASHASGSASAPITSSRANRSHSRASLISANAPSSAARLVLTSSASIMRRPGAHVVRSRSNSRSLSNSRTSCADRDILLTSFFYFLFSRFQLPRQVVRRLVRVCSAIHQIAVRFAPHPVFGRRPWPLLHFADAVQNRLPEITHHYDRFPRDHRFVQHLPDHG